MALKPLMVSSRGTKVPGVPADVLKPRQTWLDSKAYDAKARQPAALFRDNDAKYEMAAAVRRIAPPDVRVSNPAFDVTPHGLIAAIITERGIARPIGDGPGEKGQEIEHHACR